MLYFAKHKFAINKSIIPHISHQSRRFRN